MLLGIRKCLLNEINNGKLTVFLSSNLRHAEVVFIITTFFRMVTFVFWCFKSYKLLLEIRSKSLCRHKIVTSKRGGRQGQKRSLQVESSQSHLGWKIPHHWVQRFSFIMQANFCSGTKYRMAGLILNKKPPKL